MGNVSWRVLNVLIPSTKQTRVSTIKFCLSVFFLNYQTVFPVDNVKPLTSSF